MSVCIELLSGIVGQSGNPARAINTFCSGAPWVRRLKLLLQAAWKLQHYGMAPKKVCLIGSGNWWVCVRERDRSIYINMFLFMSSFSLNGASYYCSGQQDEHGSVTLEIMCTSVHRDSERSVNWRCFPTNKNLLINKAGWTRFRRIGFFWTIPLKCCSDSIWFSSI